MPMSLEKVTVRLPSSGSVGLLKSNFFFQAEDGIRDLYVTGVQTWALPISRGDIGGPRGTSGQGRVDGPPREPARDRKGRPPPGRHRPRRGDGPTTVRGRADPRG